jgi:hypothetical protein
VDREDYNTRPVIRCPVPLCGHEWCKGCQQTLQSSGPDTHTCPALSQRQQPHSQCRLCLNVIETDIVHFEQCAHPFCLACVNTIFGPLRFPVLCPICPARKHRGLLTMARKMSLPLMRPTGREAGQGANPGVLCPQ